MDVIARSCHFEELATARMLLARGANPNCRDSRGRTPLSWAVKIEWEDNSDIGPPMVQLLLEADCRHPNMEGHAPLVWAFMSALYLVHAPEMVDKYKAGVQLLLEKAPGLTAAIGLEEPKYATQQW